MNAFFASSLALHYIGFPLFVITDCILNPLDLQGSWMKLVH